MKFSESRVTFPNRRARSSNENNFRMHRKQNAGKLHFMTLSPGLSPSNSKKLENQDIGVVQRAIQECQYTLRLLVLLHYRTFAYIFISKALSSSCNQTVGLSRTHRRVHTRLFEGNCTRRFLDFFPRPVARPSCVQLSFVFFSFVVAVSLSARMRTPSSRREKSRILISCKFFASSRRRSGTLTSGARSRNATRRGNARAPSAVSNHVRCAQDDGWEQNSRPRRKWSSRGGSEKKKKNKRRRII